MEEIQGVFVFCERCGKKIIERLPNGLWRFLFGKNPDNPGFPPVEMLVHGSVKMKCIRRDCRKRYPNHWNILNYLPHGEDFPQVEGNGTSQPIVQSDTTTAVDKILPVRML